MIRIHLREWISEDPTTYVNTLVSMCLKDPMITNAEILFLLLATIKVQNLIKSSHTKVAKLSWNVLVASLKRASYPALTQWAMDQYFEMVDEYAKETLSVLTILPDVLWMEIFERMEPVTLFKMSHTCRKFRRMASGT